MNKKLAALLLVTLILALFSVFTACTQHVCTYGDWVVITEPTCVSEGLRERHCSDPNCNEIQQEKIAIDNSKHTLTSVNYVEAGCTTDGTIAHKHCSLCRKNFDQNGNELSNVTIEKGHKYTVVPTVVGGLHVEGRIEHRTCNVCHKNFAPDEDVEISEEDLIISVPHNYNADTMYCSDCDKYFITNSDQFAAFRDSVNKGETFKNKTVVLDSDIDLANEEWTPINGFLGEFDGNQHVIRNLKITGENDVGLFGNQWQCSAVIRNFTVDGANITGVENVGVIVGKTASTQISNITVKNAVINANHWAGGIVGYAYADITDCSVDGLEIICIPNVVGGGFDNGDKVGGIVGYLAANSVANCNVNNSSLKGYRDIGGIVGTLQSADGKSASAIGNTAVKVSICVDQVTNSYGAKDVNVDAIAGRVLNNGNDLAVVENNESREISYQYIVNNASAQIAFDSAKSNSVIKLVAGNYDKLYIRQSKFVSVDTTAGGSYPWYLREINDVKIVGEDGVVINGLDVLAGHMYSADNSVYNPVTGQNHNYYSNIVINNLSLSDIKFTERLDFSGWYHTLLSCDGLTVNNCEFDMSDSAQASQSNGSYAAVRFGTGDDARIWKNVVFENCSFKNAFQGIYIVNVENFTVSDCDFNNIKHNAIAIQSSASNDQSLIGTVGGKIIIENNNIANGQDRAIRFGDVGQDAVVTVTGNSFADYCDGDGEILKTGIVAENSKMLFEDNEYGGIELDTTDLVGDGSAVIIKNS